MKSVLKITKTAGEQLVRIANDNNVKNILFYVKGGGCNGFNYMLEPTVKPIKQFDEVVSYKDVNVIIDDMSIMHLLGTKIDWKKDIMGESFHFENPNAMSSCGCGTSFSINR
jgi:iron-sulfur cluster insertion protein